MAEEEIISAIILAGGKSSRMKTDKGLIYFHGMKMIEHVLHNVKPVSEHILIVSGNPEYKIFAYPVYEDIHKNHGPLGGIHSGLSNSKTDWNLVVGCDLPYASVQFLAFLVSNISMADAIIPVHDSLMEPLCALYHKSSLPKIESLLLKNELTMRDVLRKLNSKFVAVPGEKFNAAKTFRNINAPEDDFATINPS